ncbi:MAG: hypothetical protein AMS27_08285 [Bacteroides sp. SM23_62_1]|nr:MAG: hypothetical protein AMS27_08285 [Bacteroides sp. SM23_62_1]
MKKQKIFCSGIKGITFPFYAFLFLGAFLLISSVTLAQKVNFSGTWSFNEDKSELGEGRFRGAATKLTIKQEGNNMSIERVSQGRDGEEVTRNEKYTLDGKECENPAFNTTRKSTVTWSEDGKSLTISSTMVFEREGEEMEMKSSEILSLTDDGKSLTIYSTSMSPRGEMKRTYVYDKE